jgi:type IV fimbrial biogenesis protein FimT
VLRRLQSGFSLVELLIGIAILALLMALGVPEYATFLNNSRVRTTADTLVSGLNLARAEAVKRNARVQFVQTDEEPLENLVNALPQSTTGINWVVRELVPATGLHNFIEGKAGAEGSGRADATSVVVTSSSTEASYDGILTFTGFGALTIARPVTFQVTNPTAGACAAPLGAGGPIRCLNVVVSPGGQVRICDPSINVAKDTRAC